jgi:hypothetical protein
MRKLNVQSLAELVRLAETSGIELLPPPPPFDYPRWTKVQ